jgi:tetratricopeptide (TPR) repeat protein
MNCAEQAVALDAMDGISHWALAEAAFYSKQYDRSLSHMARAITLNPNDADVLAISGYLQAACGHSQLALLHMEMARERNPTSPPWYNWVNGGAFYLMGRYEDALAAFNLFGRPNPSVLRWRAATYVQLGRIDEARNDMRALLALKPDLNAREVRKFVDYMPNLENYMDALRKAGLPE